MKKATPAKKRTHATSVPEQPRRHGWSWVRSGWYGVLACALLIVLFLFLNNAGAVSLTDSDSTSFTFVGILAMVIGWPTIMGLVIGGLSSWGAGGSVTIVLICFIVGVIVNSIYAFGLGVLVGWLCNKCRP